MNEELFGELHEQEEYGLFGKEHQRQQENKPIEGRDYPYFKTIEVNETN